MQKFLSTIRSGVETTGLVQIPWIECNAFAAPAPFITRKLLKEDWRSPFPVPENTRKKKKAGQAFFGNSQTTLSNLKLY